MCHRLNPAALEAAQASTLEGGGIVHRSGRLDPGRKTDMYSAPCAFRPADQRRIGPAEGSCWGCPDLGKRPPDALTAGHQAFALDRLSTQIARIPLTQSSLATEQPAMAAGAAAISRRTSVSARAPRSRPSGRLQPIAPGRIPIASCPRGGGDKEASREAPPPIFSIFDNID